MIVETACMRLRRLKAARDELITGTAVSEVAFGDDRVKYTRADLGRLDDEIKAAEDAVREEQGVPARRTRYAMGVRFRRY